LIKIYHSFKKNSKKQIFCAKRSQNTHPRPSNLPRVRWDFFI
jgi:hypothetical protein